MRFLLKLVIFFYVPKKSDIEKRFNGTGCMEREAADKDLTGSKLLLSNRHSEP